MKTLDLKTIKPSPKTLILAPNTKPYTFTSSLMANMDPTAPFVSTGATGVHVRQVPALHLRIVATGVQVHQVSALHLPAP
jgi:hypothetical protein